MKEGEVVPFPKKDDKVIKLPNVGSYPNFLAGVEDLQSRVKKGELSDEMYKRLYTELLHRFMRRESAETPWFLREDKTAPIDQKLNTLVQKSKNNPEAEGLVSNLLDKIINFGQKVLGQKQESIIDEQPEVMPQIDIARKQALAMALLDQLEKEGRGNELGKILQVTDKTVNDLAPVLLKTVKQKAVTDAEEEAKKVTDKIKNLIYKLVQKVTGFNKDTSTEKEALSFEATKDLFEKVFEKHIQKKDIPVGEIINFINDSVEGQVLDMASLVKQRSGLIRNFVKQKYQKVYDVLFNDLQKIIPGKTGGAIGPSELAIAAIGNPSQKKKDSGDLKVGNEEYEVKSGTFVSGGRAKTGDGGRINAKKIPNGTAAVNIMQAVFKKYGIIGDDISKYLSKRFKPFSITPTNMPAWNKAFIDKKISMPKIKNLLRDITIALSGQPDLLTKTNTVPDINNMKKKSTVKDNVEQLINDAVQEKKGFDFTGLAKLISYAQMDTYNSEGKGNVLLVNKANNSFTVTKGAEDFADQIGKGIVIAKGLSVTDDPSPATFSFTAIDLK